MNAKEIGKLEKAHKTNLTCIVFEDTDTVCMSLCPLGHSGFQLCVCRRQSRSTLRQLEQQNWRWIGGVDTWELLQQQLEGFCTFFLWTGLVKGVINKFRITIAIDLNSKHLPKPRTHIFSLTTKHWVPWPEHRFLLNFCISQCTWFYTFHYRIKATIRKAPTSLGTVCTAASEAWARVLAFSAKDIRIIYILT